MYKIDEPSFAAFGAALRDARNARNLSQASVADQFTEAPLKFQHILSLWERGQGQDPNPLEVFALEAFLGCGAGVLSQHLGYVPASKHMTVEQALMTDVSLSHTARASLTAIVQAIRSEE